MFKRLYPALVITRREVRDQLRDWRIIFPVLGLTVFFPFLMNFTAQQMLGFVNRYGATIIGERLVPFLLMIVGFFPISVSLVIALETFVGEKERGSIEPLLNTPLEDWQLYLGKLLAATIPPLLSSFLGMSVYLAGLVIGGVPLPPLQVLFQIFSLTVVQAVMMVAGAVVVSSQATSVRSANLLSSFIIIPVALLIQGESVVMFWGDYTTLWWAVGGLLVLTVLLVRVGTAHFQREELLGREIDVLNVKWMWRVFRREFSGGAIHLGNWLTRSLPRALRDMRVGIWVAAGLAAAGVAIGLSIVPRFFLTLNVADMDKMSGRLQDLLDLWSLAGAAPVMAIFWQNMRVLLLASVVGAFTLGILGVLPLMASTAAVGYLYGLLVSNGFPPLTFVMLILPHAVLEIPAAVLATAAVIHAGARLATPDSSKTVGEVGLAAFANWCKIMVGVVIPLLIIAAGIESWLTPRLALLFFR